MIKNNLNKLYSLIKYKSTNVLSNLGNIGKYIEDATRFVNTSNITSTTNYLIWVDTKNFKTNIFKGSKGNWTLVHSYLCSIGKASTPTPKGTFKVGIRGLYFGKERGYICRYYTQFKGNYLFHSIIYNLNGSVRDGRLGKAISDGCVRLALENAKWIWDNIPQGSTVKIT